jgi:hypothetical protein
MDKVFDHWIHYLCGDNWMSLPLLRTDGATGSTVAGIRCFPLHSSDPGSTHSLSLQGKMVHHHTVAYSALLRYPSPHCGSEKIEIRERNREQLTASKKVKGKSEI